IRTTKAIRTQNFIATVLRNKGTYLLSKRTHVICRYHDWTLCIFQALCDVRQTCCICRVQHVPTFCILAITCQQCKGCADQTSAAIPQSLCNNSAAAMTSRKIVPEPISCTRCFVVCWDCCNRYRPLMMPSS